MSPATHMGGIKSVTHAVFACDLHSHTTRSDGNDTPYELIEAAVSRGVRVVAVTDHDVLPPQQIQLPDHTLCDACTYAASRGVSLLRGIEFSCETSIQDVHIVGLGCNWSGPEMVNEVEAIADSKAESYAETVRRLSKRGYQIDLAELLAWGVHPITLRQLQKKRIFDYMAYKKYTPDWSAAKLLVRDDPFLNVERKKPGACHIIDAIHRSGGIAVLAHPYLIDDQVTSGDKSISRWKFIEQLISGGLDGIEIRYPYHKTTCKDRRPLAEIWCEIHSRVGGRLFSSGGSDYHADYKKGTPNPRGLGECGLTLEEFMSVPKLKRLLPEETAEAF